MCTATANIHGQIAGDVWDVIPYPCVIARSRQLASRPLRLQAVAESRPHFLSFRSTQTQTRVEERCSNTPAHA